LPKTIPIFKTSAETFNKWVKEATLLCSGLGRGI